MPKNEPKEWIKIGGMRITAALLQVMEKQGASSIQVNAVRFESGEQGVWNVVYNGDVHRVRTDGEKVTQLI
jgi:hypothetical protein